MEVASDSRSQMGAQGMNGNRELLFSVTRSDFTIQTFSAGGKGGQHQNKTETGVRLIHRMSGARGEARDSRSQHQNIQAAFRRLIDSSVFKAWHKQETARRLGAFSDIDQAVDRAMSPANLRVEVRGEKGWQPE
jgi:protein subunit release factor B